MPDGSLCPATHISHTMWEVKRETLTSVPEEMRKDRWFQYVGAHILKVTKVTVRSDMFMPEYPREIPSHNWGDSYIEIQTALGTACVVQFKGHSDIQGVVLNNGRKTPKAHTMGTWRKYGHKRGHGMSWLRYQHAQKTCTSPESGKDMWEHEAYTALTGVSLTH